MPGVVRLGDFCTGHGCFPSRPNVSASTDSFANDLGIHRVGDAWAVHCCGIPCHGGSQSTGSPDVFVNNLPVARIGDSVSCGSSNSTGSPDVIVNGD